MNQNQQKIKWYLIDTERTFCKIWDFIITLTTIYNLIVTPLILTFPDIYITCIEDASPSLATTSNANATNPDVPYSYCKSGDYYFDKSGKSLRSIELAIDIIYTMEICFCFVKRSMAYRDLQSISYHYLTTYFAFDFVSTIPEMAIFNEGPKYYWLKLFKFVHLYRLHQPLSLILKFVLAKYSKKRQNDLTGFMILILLVIYSSHINACIWLYLGYESPCQDVPEIPTCI